MSSAARSPELFPSATESAVGASGSATSTDCADTQLTIDAKVADPAGGKQPVAITFINLGPAPCTLSGYPAVTLMLSGTALGNPAEHALTTPATVTLASGARATATLTVDTTCGGASSDAVRVAPPQQSGPIVALELPLVVAGCATTVSAVVSS